VRYTLNELSIDLVGEIHFSLLSDTVATSVVAPVQKKEAGND